MPFTGTGDEQGVTAVTRDDLAAHHRHWLRPDHATIFAVGDTTLAELPPLLEAQFGDWRPPAGAPPAKLFRLHRKHGTAPRRDRACHDSSLPAAHRPPQNKQPNP